MAKEGCGTFMLGYESIDGVPVTFNKWLLSDKLRGDWNYQGTLITDWDNVGRSVWEQKVKADYVHAAADAVKAGNDLIMTTPKFYEGAIEAVKTGLLDEVADRRGRVARILALKFRLGLFEDPRLPDEERIKTVIGSKAHQELNLQIARESVALLRNDGMTAHCRSRRCAPGQAHRRRGPAGRRRPGTAGRLGRQFRPGQLDAGRPAARHDHHHP